jgi:hypothetical protein
MITMSDITVNKMCSPGKVGWFIDAGNGNSYWVSEHGDVMRPLKPYKKGGKVYFNMVINGRLRRVSQDNLSQMVDDQQRREAGII